MSTQKLPKKVLRIKEISFILPDNFDGTLDDAVALLITYHQKHYSEKISIDDSDDRLSVNTILISAKGKQKLCGSYGIFTLENDTYIRDDDISKLSKKVK